MPALSERISVVSYRPHDDLRVIRGSLPAGRSIVVPLRNICKRKDFALNCTALGAQRTPTPIDPDVLSHGRERVLDPSVWVGELLAKSCFVITATVVQAGGGRGRAITNVYKSEVNDKIVQ